MAQAKRTAKAAKVAMRRPVVLKVETPSGGIYAEAVGGAWECSVPGGKHRQLGQMRVAEAAEELREMAGYYGGAIGEVLQLAADGGVVPFSPSTNGRRDAAARRELIEARKASA